ncbi:MAG: type II secretion system protein, partial [Colwellia sp.]
MKLKVLDRASLKAKQRGFTLIEVMVVVVLIGLMASLVQFNFSGNSPEDKLKH